MSDGPCLIHPGVWHTAGPCEVTMVECSICGWGGPASFGHVCVSPELAEAHATVARLTAEVATFQAMMLDCEAERDALAADLAAWKERCVAADRDRNALADQRDSLVASLEATKPCEPCQRDDHDNCTGDCSSMCCALAAAEAELSELRGRVEAAVELHRPIRNIISAPYWECPTCDELTDESGCKTRAILSPPEGP